MIEGYLYCKEKQSNTIVENIDVIKLLDGLILLLENESGNVRKQVIEEIGKIFNLLNESGFTKYSMPTLHMLLTECSLRHIGW